MAQMSVIVESDFLEQRDNFLSDHVGEFLGRFDRRTATEEVGVADLLLRPATPTIRAFSSVSRTERSRRSTTLPPARSGRA